MNAPSERYPLTWPTGWPRTKYRTVSNFGKRSTSHGGFGYKDRLTVGDGLKRLTGELSRLNATWVVISSNLQVRQDGLPYAQQPKMLQDPGVAVYFRLKGQPRVLACDRWNSVADNLAAIAGHIDAIRSVDRYGVGTLEQAFSGYTALPSAAGSWFVVLEFAAPPKTWAEVETRHTELAKRHHPDHGGNVDTMAKINAARDTARLEFGA